MRDIILQKLKEIEQEHEVKILYAVESGSRGWGFESKDSDYDVRFIYIHKPEWYMSIKEKRDVIELPINNLLDINGWDLRKTLVLFKKSNPTLLEWLSSPIIYGERTSLVNELKELLKDYFSSKSCIYHYLHMAEGNYREYLKGEEIRVKKYFYVLRPIMACMWTEKYGTQPPMLFEDLMNHLHLDKELVNEIEKLLVIKRSGNEIDKQKKINIINYFLEDKICYYKEYVKTLNIQVSDDIDALDNLFRSTLHEVWGL
ncbi:nucleotidyltransferase domain-containing protein [Vallitalea guaymasensis]|uniref:Nucleotidyltransferase domain-containing protein n=1 Tax=Vallitalea guaymasensis TaxID=1185412 RepID=A0A8J8M8S2_9FIRM|nr:nucleotidyltransferase domain-containing protein [Vallitalea guaymasensis]QUH28437.1 nucleotidyltransferase domain-containing protein [Vallitalea guaymasensis]